MNRRKAVTGIGLLIGGSALARNISGTSAEKEKVQERNNPEPASIRKKTILSGKWKFQPDIKNIGEEEHWFEKKFATTDWGGATVPQAWDCYENALWQYEGIGWFITEIGPDDTAAGKNVILLFHRVMYQAKVWLNGVFLGENANGYLPFQFDLTGLLKTGTPNTLVLRVDNVPRLEWLPAAKKIEWIQYGGILQNVELISHHPVFIEDLAINTEPAGTGATVSLTAHIVNNSQTSEKVNWSVAVGREKNQVRKTQPFTIAAGASVILNMVVSLDRAERWSPDNPVLYTALATLHKNDPDSIPVLDSVSERFGIRKITVSGTKILLNGKPLTIKGVNRYDDYGSMGPTVPAELLREEIVRMKSAGINFIRVHYPQSPELISLYDEYGLMMMEEIPMTWWGRNDIQTMDILKQAKPSLARMIKRDKNHPSLIIWSMSNECVTDSETGIAVMRDLLIQAKAQDPNRLVTYVIDGNDDPLRHLALDKADIICINKYYGVLHDKICRHMADIDSLGYQPFVSKMKKHREDLPGKPMLVTEFGAQGIKSMHGDLYFSEEFQAAYMERIWEGIKDVEGLSGGVLWCWADYFHRKYLIGYAAFGPYGVVTVDRKAKKSLSALVRMYEGTLKLPV